MAVRDELQAQVLFQERYSNRPSPVARQIEQRVIGGDWGANGYTTMTQADTLAHELHLSAGDRLLDLGTGRGWPGLYLAARTAVRSSSPTCPWKGYAWPPTAPPLKGLPPVQEWWRRGQRAAVPSRRLRRRHPHRRAVLTTRQALRAESLQTAPATRRTHRLLHHR
jgi:hypothetical protein